MINVQVSANAYNAYILKQGVEQKLLDLNCHEDGHENFVNELLVTKENDYSIVRCCCEAFAASIAKRLG